MIKIGLRQKKYIGGLKVVILAPGLCVGFAGENIEFARNAIQGIYDEGVNLFDKNKAIDYFLEHHLFSVKNGSPIDFIVAVIVECNEKHDTFLKEIFRIADSKVYWENDATQIGNRDAFNNFQEIFHQGHQSSNVPTFQISSLGAKEHQAFHRSLSSAMSAMQGVIDNSKISNVDGFSTIVVSEEDQFKYIEYLQLRGTPIPVSCEPSAPMRFGGAAEGSDHKHVGMFSASGHGIFPVYSITGCFGLIYQPEKSFEPKIIRNCTEAEFCAKVEECISDAHKRALAFQNQM